MTGISTRVLARLADFIAARPWFIVAPAVVLTLACVWPAAHIEVTTSRTRLSDNQKGSMAIAEHQFGDFLEEFGSPNDLITVVDGGDVEDRRKASDEMTRILEVNERVGSCFNRVDLGFFTRRILLFAEVSDIATIKKVLEAPMLEGIRQGKVSGIDKMVDEVTRIFEDTQAATASEDRIVQGIDAIRTLAEELQARVEDPERRGLGALRKLVPPLSGGAIDEAGYLQSRDGGMKVIFVKPKSKSDEQRDVRPLVKSVREAAALVMAKHAGYVNRDGTPVSPVRIRVTGLPALQIDEQVIVDGDIAYTTTASLALIALILIYGYRKPQQVLLSMVPLLMGTAWTVAFAQLSLGKLNMIASAFMPILLGRGSDFAIYLIARFNAAVDGGKDTREAVRESLAAAGGIITGGLVTAAAFFTATLGQFGVFSQLGMVVGTGIVLILVASLLVTPALLVLVGRQVMPGERAMERVLSRIPEFGAGPGVIGVRWPLATIAAKDTEDAREKAKILNDKKRSPNVGRVESIASFWPTGQDAKLEKIRELKPLVEAIPEFRPPVVPTSPAAFAESLQRFADAVDDKIYVADQNNRKAIVEPLKALKQSVLALRDSLKKVPEGEAKERVHVLEGKGFEHLTWARNLVRQNVLDIAPIGLPELPAATRERFVGRTGKSAVYIFPLKPGSGDELAAFIGDVRKVDPEATGFPVIYFESSRSVLRGFLRAAGFAFLVIAAAILLHFRNLGATALTILPLLLAVLATGGIMELTGITHNVANIVALPLLIGLGTDYGLQLIHHFRAFPEESLRMVMRKTCLGVFMAAGTTAAGFGALGLAVHKGAQSLGLVLFIGCIASMACALVLVPACLALVDRKRANPDA